MLIGALPINADSAVFRAASRAGTTSNSEKNF